MKVLAALCLTLLLAFALAQSQEDYCADVANCNCDGNVGTWLNDFATNQYEVACVGRTWTITADGSFRLPAVAGSALVIGSDLVTFSASEVLFEPANTAVRFYVNPEFPGRSGKISFNGPMTFTSLVQTDYITEDAKIYEAGVTFNTTLLESEQAITTSIPATSTAPAKQISIDPTYAPVIAFPNDACMTFAGGQSLVSSTPVPRSVDKSDTFSIIDGRTCEGKDRGWVVGVIIVLCAWGALLGLFTLLTCKIDSLWAKFWEVD